MCVEKTVAIALSVAAVAWSLGTSARAADAEHGKKVFAACSVCHTTDDSSRAGPGLGGIVGRRAGSLPGFHYSRAMKHADFVWNDKKLDAYISSPQRLVPGNIMPFSGIADAADRADVIAYLETLR